MHVGQNDFVHYKDRSSGFFAIGTVSEDAILVMGLRSQHFVFYLDYLRERRVNKLRIEKVLISFNSVFIDHDYTQNAGEE